MKLAALVLLGAVFLATPPIGAAAALQSTQPEDTETDDNGWEKDVVGPEDYDKANEWSVTEGYSETSTSGPGTSNPVFATGDAGLADVLSPRYPEPPCILYTGKSDGDGGLTIQCAISLTCGYERVDDPITGKISGTNGLKGRFAQYIGELGITSQALEGTPGATVEGIAQLIVTQGLQNPPNNRAIPVMRWCERSDNNRIETVEPAYKVTFGWDVTIDNTYPIDPTRTTLVGEVTARLRLNDPDIGTTPALDTGGTWVKFPTWLWINDPLTEVRRYAVNDTETLRVEIRARLQTITFTHGDQTIECGPNDMTAYSPDTHHPIDDAPNCTITHEQTGEHDLTATLTYIIEQRIRYAYNGIFDANQPWEPHEAGTVPITTNLGNYPIQELHSLITIGDT